MLYQVSRNGQIYGPYTLEDLQRYVTSGNVLLSDLAKTETETDWVPVSQILGDQTSNPPLGGTVQGAGSAGFAASGFTNPAYGERPYDPAGAANAGLAASQYPDAPNLNWGLVLLFSFLTCSLFMFIWNFIVAAWLKRVQPNATSLFYYIGAAVLLFVQILVTGIAGTHAAMHPGVNPLVANPGGSILGLLAWIARLVARFSQRASLEEHFNGPEPVGLRLNPIMTFFFGGIYFQYHLNRINAMKQGARYGAGRAY